jgi:hypothetical protein
VGNGWFTFPIYFCDIMDFNHFLVTLSLIYYIILILKIKE